MPNTPDPVKKARANNIWYFLRMRNLVVRLGERLDLSSAEVVVLLAVYLGQYRDNPMDITEVAKEANLPRSNVVRHLKVLIDRGLVRQETDAKRIVNLITNKAEEMGMAEWYDEYAQTCDVLYRHRQTVDRRLSKMESKSGFP